MGDRVMGNWVSRVVLAACLLTACAGAPLQGASAGEVAADQDSTPVSGGAGPRMEASDDQERSFVDTAHEEVSRAFLASAGWLDSFFDEENYAAEDNRSRLRLRSEAFFEEGDSPSFEVRASLRITFPRTNERLQLILTGNEDEEEALDVPGGVSRAQAAEEDEEDFSLGLRYFFEQNEKNNIGLGAGVRVRNSRVAAYVGPRWRFFVPLGSWDFRSVQRARWFTDDGWDWLSRFDFERNVFATLLFRSRTDIEWFEDDDGLFPEQRFSLFHPLDTVSALKYEWINQFVTEPSFDLDDLILRVRYRQRIWRDWLFVEAGPDVSFPKDRDHEFTPGFFFRLEAIVGTYERLGASAGADGAGR